MSKGRLWAASGAGAALLAALSALAVPLLRRLQPRGGVWLSSGPELWLLMVFTEGALGLLLGLSLLAGLVGLAGGGRPVPSARAAGSWAVLTGLLLLLIYALATVWVG